MKNESIFNIEVNGEKIEVVETHADEDGRIDCNIMLNGNKIGYITYWGFDVDEDEERYSRFCYLADISIDDEENRNHGYGTAIIKAFAEEWDDVYLCPENERCTHLYERLGVEADNPPREVRGQLDTFDTMYQIYRRW